MRPYAAMEDRLRALIGSRPDRMRRAVDILWDGLASTGVSWVGFYTASPGDAQMVLGPCRNKPACSPIELHGACGRSWTTGRALVVSDVRALGAGYIACDPRDRSEVVIPLFDRNECWGVLDLDSFDVGSFDVRDAHELDRLMVIAGLTTDARREDPIVV
ncbi:MAG: hypothetical protein Kow0022_06830 [Phycisphaerales bacterium]